MVTTTSSPASQDSIKTFYWEICGTRIRIEVDSNGQTYVNGALVQSAYIEYKTESPRTN